MQETSPEGRLARLEAVVESLSSSVASLEGSIERYISLHKTNWNTIFSGIGVLILVVFAMNQAIVAPLERDVSHTTQAAIILTEDFKEIRRNQYDLNSRVSQLEAIKEINNDR